MLTILSTIKQLIIMIMIMIMNILLLIIIIISIIIITIIIIIIIIILIIIIIIMSLHHVIIAPLRTGRRTGVIIGYGTVVNRRQTGL